MKKADSKSKRQNRTVLLNDAVGGVMDPLLRKRGFANRELIERWHAIAPPPYNSQSLPDQLKWGRQSDAATLVLRCADGLKLLVTHDAPMIVGAVNRYFGYVLVDNVRLSAAPFTPGSGEQGQSGPQPDEKGRKWVAEQVGDIESDALRDALTHLGEGIAAKAKS